MHNKILYQLDIFNYRQARIIRSIKLDKEYDIRKDFVTMYKVFKVKRGKISFREVVEFNSLFEELKWRFQMMIMGCKVQSIKIVKSSK